MRKKKDSLIWRRSSRSSLREMSRSIRRSKTILSNMVRVEYL